MKNMKAGGWQDLLTDLEAGTSVRLLVSPVAEKIIPDIERLYAYMMDRGVLSVHRVLPFADMAVWLYYKELQKGRNLALITSACAGVSIYLQSNAAVNRRGLLSTAPSPLRCAAWYLRNQYGYREPFAFLSPCLLKGCEKQDIQGKAPVHYNAGIADLLEWIQVCKPGYTNYDPVPPVSEHDFPGFTVQSYGSIGGPLKKLIPALSVQTVEGIKELEKLLQDSPVQTQIPRMYEVYACKGGCYNGSATRSSNRIQPPLVFSNDGASGSCSAGITKTSSQDLFALFRDFDQSWSTCMSTLIGI